MQPSMKSIIAVVTLLLMLLLVCACTDSGGKKQGDFIQIGEFTVNRMYLTRRTDVRDGAGRTLVLVPRGAQVPSGCGSQAHRAHTGRTGWWLTGISMWPSCGP